ncbi:hypothetical protein LDENG_00261820, partial [Lucifuga dentata]
GLLLGALRPARLFLRRRDRPVAGRRLLPERRLLVVRLDAGLRRGSLRCRPGFEFQVVRVRLLGYERRRWSSARSRERRGVRRDGGEDRGALEVLHRLHVGLSDCASPPAAGTSLEVGPLDVCVCVFRAYI